MERKEAEKNCLLLDGCRTGLYNFDGHSLEEDTKPLLLE